MGSGDAIAQQFFETKKEGKGHDVSPLACRRYAALATLFLIPSRFPPCQLTRTGRFAVYGTFDQMIYWNEVAGANAGVAASLSGFVFHAPILAQWFKLVDKVPFQSKGRAVVTKVIMDQTLWGPFSVRRFRPLNPPAECRS